MQSERWHTVGLTSDGELRTFLCAWSDRSSVSGAEMKMHGVIPPLPNTLEYVDTWPFATVLKAVYQSDRKRKECSGREMLKWNLCDEASFQERDRYNYVFPFRSSTQLPRNAHVRCSCCTTYSRVGRRNARHALRLFCMQSVFIASPGFRYYTDGNSSKQAVYTRGIKLRYIFQISSGI